MRDWQSSTHINRIRASCARITVFVRPELMPPTLAREIDAQLDGISDAVNAMDDEITDLRTRLAAMTAYARALEQYATTNRVAPGDSEDEAIAALRSKHGITDETEDG